MSVQRFRTRIVAGQSKNVTGIEVPAEAINAFGAGQRPRLKVCLNSYEYVSSVGRMNGRFMISLSAAHRDAAGLKGDDEVDVVLELADEPPPSVIPDDVTSALQLAGLLDQFDRAAPSRKKEWLRQIEDAKAQETRVRRIQKLVEALA